MTATPQSRLDTRLKTLAVAAGERDFDSEHGSEPPEPIEDSSDAEVIREFVNACNPENLTETPPEAESTLKIGTLSTYAGRLTELARFFVLTEATADDVHQALRSY